MKGTSMKSYAFGVPGVHFCHEAFLAFVNDQPLDPAHVASCHVCLRKQRMDDAKSREMQELDITTFYDILDQMADEYIGKESGIDADTARAFYAAMAKDIAKEDFFAACVDALLNPIESTARFVDLAQARSERTYRT